eukprot:357924-Chlamydomonas_euryale.AAC.5
MTPQFSAIAASMRTGSLPARALSPLVLAAAAAALQPRHFRCGRSNEPVPTLWPHASAPSRGGAEGALAVSCSAVEGARAPLPARAATRLATIQTPDAFAAAPPRGLSAAPTVSNAPPPQPARDSRHLQL